MVQVVEDGLVAHGIRAPAVWRLLDLGALPGADVLRVFGLVLAAPLRCANAGMAGTKSSKLLRAARECSKAPSAWLKRRQRWRIVNLLIWAIAVSMCVQ
jgi:hypothetical protein